MQALNSRHLFSLHADLEMRDLGRTPFGERRVYAVQSGWIEGRVSGTVLRSGTGDWPVLDADGCQRTDARLVAELDDGALVYITFQGRMVFPTEAFPPSVSDEQVDPSSYYMRMAPLFETASVQYGWLNRILAVGVGRLTKTGVVYETFEIL